MIARDVELTLADCHTRVTTRDMAEATPVIERLQGRFVALERPLQGRLGEPVQVRATACGEVDVSTFTFGRVVDIVPQALANAVLVTTAIAGRAGLASRSGTFGIGIGATFIAQEEDEPTFLYDSDTEVLKLRFDRSRLERACASFHDQAFVGKLRFDTRMASPDAMRRWVTLLRFVIATLNANAERSPGATELARIEDMLMLTLLGIQPHNYQVHQRPGSAAASPRQFRLALDYIHHHIRSDLRLADIAAAAGCSARSLTRAFQHASEATPMQHVQQLRLQSVRNELSQSPPIGKTIADIAYGWGFRHLGEFNRRYRLAYGEKPSETRQRRDR